MIIKAIKKVIGLMLVVIMLISLCSSRDTYSVSKDYAKLVFEDIKRQYRLSDAVITGLCVDEHINAYGEQCYDILIQSVIAGKVEVGDIIHCPTSEQLQREQTYIFCISLNSELDFSENALNYNLLSSAPIKNSGDLVEWNSTHILYSDFIDEMKSLNSVITVPSRFYYYNELNDLVNNCEEIFIGKVIRTPAPGKMNFRSEQNGSSVENMLETSIVTVRALGSIKGKFSYGDEIRLVNASELANSVVFSDTLSPVTMSYPVSHMSVGSIYLFFLNPSIDSKNDYYFDVNAFQGHIMIVNDNLIVSASNLTLYKFNTLTELVSEIKMNVY